MNLEGGTPPSSAPLESDRVDRLVDRTWMGIVGGQTPQPPSRHRPRAVVADGVVDLVGVGLVVTLVVWTVALAWLEGGDPTSLTVVAGAGLLAFGLTRAMPRRRTWLGPLIVVAASVLLSVFPLGGTVATGRRFGALAYANASALLYVLSTAAAGMLAVRSRAAWMRRAAVAGAFAFAAAVIASGSRAGIAVLALVPIAAVTRRPRHVRAFLRFGAALVLVAISMTLLLGALHATRGGPDTIGGVANSTLTSRRLDLWRDSLRIAAREPLTGVGPGGFRHASPTALRDEDAVAAHNEYLQAAAALGLPGFALAVALVFWAYMWLWSSGVDRGSALAGAGLTAAAVHASVDYVFHAPAIVLALAVLIGTGPAVTRVGDRDGGGRASMGVAAARRPAPETRGSSRLRR